MARSFVWISGRVDLTLLRYVAVSVFGFGIGTGVLWVLIGLVGLHTAIAGATAGLVSMFHDFAWHERWTFASARQGNTIFRFLRFFMSKAAGYFVALGVLVALAEGTGIHYLAANIFAVGASFVWNYTLSNLWVWKRKP